MKPIRVGFAMCGSFCSFEKAFAEMEHLVSEGYELYPIMSGAAYGTDTRFGRAAGFAGRAEGLCGRAVIHTIVDAEPIGPRGLLDVLAVAPCTGNTLAKLACGITDTSVTMACKAHWRNGRPVVLAVATNDALSANWQNIGRLAVRRNTYFVPFRQDDPAGKATSLAADLPQLLPTLRAALEGRQLQPVLGASD